MPLRGDFSMGMGDALLKNKVWLSKMIDDQNSQNNVNNNTF